MVDLTDRELLEKAAKAAGIPPYHPIGHGDRGLWVEANMEIGKSGYWWNPLTDDGDALRLAVKLEMKIDWGQFDVVVSEFDSDTVASEKKGTDPYAATRRAIVRAAASLATTQPRSDKQE